MKTRKITDEQLVQEIKNGASNKAISQKYGINIRNVHIRKNKLALKGFSPEHGMTKQVPEMFVVKGVSSLYGEDGTLKAQWVKSTIDREKQQELLLETIKALSDELPRYKPSKLPGKEYNSNLLNLYPITDYHLGMLAWAEESGEDYDIQIAEKLLLNWFEQAILLSPDSETAILANIGDFLHYDGLESVTPSSGHVLDADSRFQKVVRVAIRVIRQVITMLLNKHKHVKVFMLEGNHDEASSIWLKELFNAVYENEPRVHVDVNPDPYGCHEFGDTSIYFHHGHKRKAEQLDTVLVSKFREIYGRTKYHYAHTGHLHHLKTIESNLMVIEQHRTLAAKDAYASRGGWMSGRSATVITYSQQYGEVARNTINYDMLR